MDALDWYSKAIEITSRLGVKTTGGHIAAQSCHDYENAERRIYQEKSLLDSVEYLSSIAYNRGLKMILWEPMPILREPPCTIKGAPIQLCTSCEDELFIQPG